MVPSVGLQCVILVFPDPTHLPFGQQHIEDITQVIVSYEKASLLNLI